jgi:hypothetical protein
MQVIELSEGDWAVTDNLGGVIKSGFASNEQAWRWADNNSVHERALSDQYNRIRMAFNGSSESDRY